MHEPTRFGRYLLLKRLSEDPLGETHRAGRVDGDSIGEHVRLRIFNLAGVSSQDLVKSMRDYEPIAQKLQGPGLTYHADCGDVSGVAYTAYPYNTAWDMKALNAKANSGFSNLERDHALLLAERIAKGLSVVHQADPATARPCHGLLLPQSVLITADGEVQLQGFSTAGYLVGKVSSMPDSIKVYLSPEVRAGAAPGPADDIYSLGAILWELLMGKPPAMDISEQMTTHLAMAQMVDGEVLPAGLAELLQSSMAPARVRTAEAMSWHKQLTDWMTRREIKTTHFDLAFFIHELFRTAIQEEEAELEKEKGLDLSRPAEPAPAMPEAAPSTPRESTRTGTMVAAQKKKSNAGIFIGLAALVILAVGVMALIKFRQQPAAPAVTEAPPVEAAAPPPAAAETASPELQLAELELERLVQERAASVGDQLSAEYDEQIRSLREQLVSAQAEAEAEAQRIVTEPAPPVEEPAPEAPEPVEEPAEDIAAATPPAEVVPEKEPAPAPPPPVVEDASPEPAMTPPPPPAVQPPQQAAPPPAPADSVITPPKRIRMPEPVYPPRARQMRKQATVLVKVLVDARGKVRDAKPVVDRNDPYGFTQSAIRAARSATFEPGQRDGVKTEMWTTIVVMFKN